MRFKLSLLAMVTMLGVGYTGTVDAQQQPQPDAQRIDVQDDRDDGMDMGWIGLLGLTGLFGLKRSAEVRQRTAVVDRDPSTVSR